MVVLCCHPLLRCHSTLRWYFFVCQRLCVKVHTVKREAVIAGLASEGLALLLGSAEVGDSAVVGPTPTDPVEFRKCTQGLRALSAAEEYTNEERGGGRDPGVRRPGVGRGQFPARSKIFRAESHRVVPPTRGPRVGA